MSQITEDYWSVENVLREYREHLKSVEGKETPFRVCFSYGDRSRSYRYYTNREDAERGTDARASYGPMGRAVIRRPRSKRIEVQGPRGGWHRETL